MTDLEALFAYPPDAAGMVTGQTHDDTCKMAFERIAVVFNGITNRNSGRIAEFCTVVELFVFFPGGVDGYDENMLGNLSSSAPSGYARANLGKKWLLPPGRSVAIGLS
jgi:hypothetical protein